MDELGKLSTAWREKAIIVGRDSFLERSTAYLGQHGRDAVDGHPLFGFHHGLHWFVDSLALITGLPHETASAERAYTESS